MIRYLSCFIWVLLTLLLCPNTRGRQADTAPDDLLSNEQAAFANAVAVAAPFVVQIETFGGGEKGDRQAIGEGPVTGTIVDKDGWIVSSLYSFRQVPASILVSLPGGNRVPARIIARDYSREIALLKVETPEPLPVASSADVSQLQVGQWCIAIGKTYDSRTVTQSIGIISALGRAYGRAVQTDAKVSPINYGGPLIDLEGNVVGILSPIAAAEMLEDDPSMLYDSGIGFAIPLQDIVKRLPKLQEGKDIRPGKLGVVLKTQNELLGPVVLSGAAPGTPAAKAGAKAGDIVAEGQGSRIELLADLRAALAQVDAGDQFAFEVKRGSERLKLSCELTADVPVYRRRYLGLKLAEVEEGLHVTFVDANSPADKAGLKLRQILTHCNGSRLASQSDLIAMVAVSELDSTLSMTVLDPSANDTRAIVVSPSIWPSELIEHSPEKIIYLDSEGKEDPNAKATIRLLKLADIPNQIHAIVPPQSNRKKLGCLLLFPEPGTVEPEKLKAQWEDFAKNYGWLVVVPTSANAKNWSRDEVTELPGRLIARLSQEYNLDRLRTIVAGMGIGGQLAIRAAITGNNQFSAVLTVNTPLKPFPLPRQNMPLQSIDFLFIGPKMESVVQPLNQQGFVANSLNPPGLDLTKWNTVPMEAIVKWLESLGHI